MRGVAFTVTYLHLVVSRLLPQLIKLKWPKEKYIIFTQHSHTPTLADCPSGGKTSSISETLGVSLSTHYQRPLNVALMRHFTLEFFGGSGPYFILLL